MADHQMMMIRNGPDTPHRHVHAHAHPIKHMPPIHAYLHAHLCSFVVYINVSSLDCFKCWLNKPSSLSSLDRSQTANPCACGC